MQTKLLLWELFSQIPKRCGYIIVSIMLLAVQLTIADEMVSPAVQQQITVTGVVVDDLGDALPGVTVTLKGSPGVGTACDNDGRFSINVPNQSAVLVFTYIGFETREITVGAQRILNVAMTEDVQKIDEVVVTGYGTQKRATLTGSINTVSSKELTITKNENVVNMLAGKMPGLRISQRTSQPGQYNTFIDVRGFGEPLFVIDGVARDRDYFARLDPEEIESISLLKDAAAAIYGIRAANGVMLVNTKSGVAKNGKVDISYSGNITFQQMIFIPDGYTEYEWMYLRNEQEYRDFNNMYFARKNAKHSQEELTAALTANVYDWQSKVFRNVTPQTQHNINVNGGSETLRYFVSLGYLRQDGCYSSGSLWADKFNLRSNVDATIVKGLNMRFSLGGTIGTNHEPGAGLWDNYKAAFLAIPGTPFYANDNPDYLNGYTPWNNEFTNLLGKMDEKYVGYSIRNDRRLNGSLKITYDIAAVKGLSVSAFYDYFINAPDQTNYKKMYNTYSYNNTTDTYNVAKLENGPNSTITRRADYTTGTNMQLAASYNNSFGQHSVNGQFVFEEVYSKWDNFTASRILKLNTEYLFAGEADGQTGSGDSPGDRSQRAFIGQINYDYSGKYLLTLIGRYEANSRWPKDSRWGFFPSVTLGWRVSEENFIKENFNFISNIKLRGSYGRVGDEGNARNYPDVFVGYETHNNFGWIFSDGVPQKGLRATAIPNLQKTWITVIMQNVGIDAGVLQNKITGSFDLFRRDRDGLMAENSAVVPGTIGANLPQININKDRTFGWEVELTYRDRISDFNYFVSGQFSSTRRMWRFRQESPASNSYDHWRNRYSGRYHNDDFWWSRKMEGMFTSTQQIRNFQTYPIGQGTLPGDWWQLDWNGDGIINDQDQYPMATRGLAWLNYGFTLGGSYKNFDLTANFQGVSRVYQQLSEVFTEALPFGGQNSLNWYLDRWHPEDPNADYWHPDTRWISGYYPLTGGDGRRSQSNGINDASYLRMKTLEVGYSLPARLLAKANIKNLRVFLNGYNLLTITPLRHVDPERPSSTARAGGADENTGYVGMYGYPNNKTYTGGLRLTF